MNEVNHVNDVAYVLNTFLFTDEISSNLSQNCLRTFSKTVLLQIQSSSRAVLELALLTVLAGTALLAVLAELALLVELSS